MISLVSHLPAEEVASFHLTGFPALVVIFVILMGAFGLPAMKIANRVGMNKWWGVLMAVPFVNIVAIWVFSIRDWPMNKRGLDQ